VAGSQTLFVGYANVDVIARLQGPVERGGRLTVERIHKLPGGMAANAACAAATVGSQALFCGLVGGDPFGELLLADFRRFGVELCPAAATAPYTTTCVILVYSDGERFIVSEPSNFDSGPLRQYLAQAGDRLRGGVLYVDGYHLGVAAEELRLARALGLRVFCDLDGGPDTYAPDELLAHLVQVDVALANRAVLARLFGEQPPEEGCRRLLSRVGAVILTQGAEAVRLFTPSGSRDFPVPPAGCVVDTIGAGDVFSGVFVASWAAERSVEEAIAAAVKAAAISVEYPGARGGLDAVRRALEGLV
jgi:sulfofructose kinase